MRRQPRSTASALVLLKKIRLTTGCLDARFSVHTDLYRIMRSPESSLLLLGVLSRCYRQTAQWAAVRNIEVVPVMVVAGAGVDMDRSPRSVGWT